MSKAKLEHNGNEITAEWIFLSPAAAKDWLARNVNIRKMNERRAKKYARDILKDQWNPNGESMKFDRHGNMIDGQTRCRAVELANKGIWTLVVKGVETTTNVDTGKSRTLSQILASLGHQSSAALAGAINYFYSYEQTQGFGRGGSIEAATYTDSLLFLETQPELLESLRHTMKTRTLFGRWSLHAALHYIFRMKTDKEFADKFYSELIEGFNMTAYSPLYHLREKLISAYRSESRLKPDPMAGMVIKAWNYWLDNRSIKVFKYNYANDGVPAIKGMDKEDWK